MKFPTNHSKNHGCSVTFKYWVEFPIVNSVKSLSRAQIN